MARHAASAPGPVPDGPWVRILDHVDASPVLEAMRACQQNPVHHGEGDVLAHTQLVLDEVRADWATLDAADREVLWLATLLHDCGKPATTREEDGRLRAPGHARVGAILARRLLWQMGIGWETRERVCGLVRWHMTPYHLLDRDDAVRQAVAMSLDAEPRLLRMLVTADALGRISPDRETRAADLELVWEFMDDLGCLDGPYPFASDHARFAFFGSRDPGRDPAYPAYDDTRGSLTLLSGLPGSGKDHWVQANAGDASVVSLDQLRSASGARRRDSAAQGRVIAAAREQVREGLRRHGDVVWNTTGLSRQLRSTTIELGRDYGARVRIVCVDTPRDALRAQNRNRADPVPEAAFDRLLGRWEFPSLEECHEREVVSVPSP